MNILLLSNTTTNNVLANKLNASHQCTHLFIQANHPYKITAGTTVAINVNDFFEVEAFCIAHKIGLVVINQIELLQQGLFNFLNDDQREWKGIVTGCSRAFFDEPFAATSTTKSIATLISDGKKYFNITTNSLQDYTVYLEKFMQCLTENNYGVNGFIEVFVSEENSMKYYPCLFNENILQHLETDLVSIFAAAYNGTFEDVNVEFI